MTLTTITMAMRITTMTKPMALGIKLAPAMALALIETSRLSVEVSGITLSVASKIADTVLLLSSHTAQSSLKSALRLAALLTGQPG